MTEPLHTPDFSGIKEALLETWVVGAEWVIPLILVLLAMAIITRDTEKWCM